MEALRPRLLVTPGSWSRMVLVTHGSWSRRDETNAGCRGAPSKLHHASERCQSGRLGRSRKPLYARAYRGFESHPLRHELNTRYYGIICLCRLPSSADISEACDGNGIAAVRRRRFGSYLRAVSARGLPAATPGDPARK